MSKTIPINLPQIDNREIMEVVKVLRSGILTGHSGKGPMVKRFESEFSSFISAKHAIAVNTGTAALHMALLAAKLAPQEEVILPSFTFTATAEAVSLVGARPVFVDINPKTYNIDLEKIEALITEKTKIIIAVDLYGLPVNITSIIKIAEKYGLTVVEDAAQAHGAKFRGKSVGAFSDMTCWSFYASKNMTTGEGGMVTTNNDEYAERLRNIRKHGEKEGYKSVMLGHNYRMPEIEAAIGHVQLQKLPRFIERRSRNAKLLSEKLRNVKTIQLPIDPEDSKLSGYLYTVRFLNDDVKMRNKLVQKLRDRGIDATVYYSTPIHLMPYYRRFGEYYLPETEKAAQQVFSLPINPSVTEKEIDYIGKSVIKVLKEMQNA